MYIIKCDNCGEDNQLHEKMQGKQVQCSICLTVIQQEQEKQVTTEPQPISDFDKIKSEMTTKDKQVILIPMVVLAVVVALFIGIGAIKNSGGNKPKLSRTAIKAKSDISQTEYISTLQDYSKKYKALKQTNGSAYDKHQLYEALNSFIKKNRIKDWKGRVSYFGYDSGDKYKANSAYYYVKIWIETTNGYRVGIKAKQRHDPMLQDNDIVVFSGTVTDSCTSITESGQMDEPEFVINLRAIKQEKQTRQQRLSEQRQQRLVEREQQEREAYRTEMKSRRAEALQCAVRAHYRAIQRLNADNYPDTVAGIEQKFDDEMLKTMGIEYILKNDDAAAKFFDAEYSKDLNRVASTWVD